MFRLLYNKFLNLIGWRPTAYLFHTIDISFYWLFFAIKNCFLTRDGRRQEILAQFQQTFRSSTKRDISFQIYPIYSCRSGFDLVLSSLQLPQDSEIIMSGLNIKHMAYLPQMHGYQVLAMDLKLESLEPDYDLLERMIGPRTQAIVYAQLFGIRIDLSRLGQIAKKHNLLLIEDCAQSNYDNHYLGSPHADFTIFSYGLSKDFNSFGGGYLVVRHSNPAYWKRIEKNLAEYPIESRWQYLITVLLSGIKWFLSTPFLVFMIDRIAKLFGYDYEWVINKIAKEFNYQNDYSKLFKKFRKQCSTPHLENIVTRLTHSKLDNFCHNSLQKSRKIKGDYLTRNLNEIVTIPGNAYDDRYYWLYPIIVENREELLKKLSDAHIIGGRTATSFGTIDDNIFEKSKRYLEFFPTNCRNFADNVVYLPYSPDVPNESFEKIIEIINQHSNSN